MDNEGIFELSSFKSSFKDDDWALKIYEKFKDKPSVIRPIVAALQAINEDLGEKAAVVELEKAFNAVMLMNEGKKLLDDVDKVYPLCPSGLRIKVS